MRCARRRRSRRSSRSHPLAGRLRAPGKRPGKSFGSAARSIGRGRGFRYVFSLRRAALRPLIGWWGPTPTTESRHQPKSVGPTEPTSANPRKGGSDRSRDRLARAPEPRNSPIPIPRQFALVAGRRARDRTGPTKSARAARGKDGEAGPAEKTARSDAVRARNDTLF